MNRPKPIGKSNISTQPATSNIKTKQSIVSAVKSPTRKFNPLEYLYSGLSRQQIIEIREAFNNFDVYGIGQVEVKEIKEAFQNLGFGKQNKFVMKMLDYMQKQNQGVIGFKQFLDISSLKISDQWSQEQTNRIFAIYDTSNISKLSYYDLQDISNDLGGMFQQSDLERMFNKADPDQDGYITQEDFYRIMTGQQLEEIKDEKKNFKTEPNRSLSASSLKKTTGRH